MIITLTQNLGPSDSLIFLKKTALFQQKIYMCKVIRFTLWSIQQEGLCLFVYKVKEMESIDSASISFNCS